MCLRGRTGGGGWAMGGWVLMGGMGGEGVQSGEGVVPPGNAAEVNSDSRYCFRHPVYSPS